LFRYAFSPPPAAKSYHYKKDPGLSGVDERGQERSSAPIYLAKKEAGLPAAIYKKDFLTTKRKYNKNEGGVYMIEKTEIALQLTKSIIEKYDFYKFLGHEPLPKKVDLLDAAQIVAKAYCIILDTISQAHDTQTK